MKGQQRHTIESGHRSWLERRTDNTWNRRKKTIDLTKYV